MIEQTVSVLAHGKINWTLDVFDRRPDGLHEIATIMQRIELADTLTFTKIAGEKSITVTGQEKDGVPVDETNVVLRAATLLGVGGVRVEIEKNIPNRAGLGGGSSDCASALRGLNDLFNLNLDAHALAEIAEKLGADVPFFLGPHCAKVVGFGDKVSRIPPIDPIDLVIVKPDIGVSTANAYAELDRVQNRVSANGTSQWPRAGASNDFETVIYSLYPQIHSASQALKDAGAEQTLLCGSGAAVMGWGPTALDIETGLRSKGFEKVWLTRTIG
jgi:4-diphosphocytidyl-2-C-methyl-D-erythritol kinase